MNEYKSMPFDGETPPVEWNEELKFKTTDPAPDDEICLFNELLTARRNAGMTQSQVAEKMGTAPPAVARLESGGGKAKHSPSIATLRRYAEAVGCHLEIKLMPRK